MLNETFSVIFKHFVLWEYITVVAYFFFVAFFVPRVFQSCDDELHVLYSSSDDVHSCDAPNIQYIFCWKEGGLRDRCSG